MYTCRALFQKDPRKFLPKSCIIKKNSHKHLRLHQLVCSLVHKVGGNLQSGVLFFSWEAQRLFASQGVIVLQNLSHKQGKDVKTAFVSQKCSSELHKCIYDIVFVSFFVWRKALQPFSCVVV